MSKRIPVLVDDQLQLIVAGGRAQLTPHSALRLAETLVRAGFRQMMLDEADCDAARSARRLDA